MKINLRWMVQAVAFMGSIFFFIKIWNASKHLLSRISSLDLVLIGIYGILFLVCFFVMAVTSYLKQKVNGTLKNQIPVFEKLLSMLGLT
ncbi:MAG: hypothetical protein ACE5G1_06760 [bacterium]